MPPTAQSPKTSYEQLLHEAVAEYYADPLGFVLFAWPWGEPGWLKDHSGPDVWQRDFLTTLGKEVASRGFDGLHTVTPVRMAASSGHGVGKSVMAAFIVSWLMSTRPHAKGVVTANTSDQLRDKTWATIRRWVKASKTGHWFEINTERMYHKAHPASWFCSAQTCREENSEAFAGQHAADSSSFYVNDEDSNVPDKIHEVQWGGLTDGEPFQFLFGNATRNYGAFYDACFGKMRHRYISKVIDSRTSKFTNKEEIAALIQDYGLDSDRVRVRVLGLPPAASDAQFISSAMVMAAQERPVTNLGDEPLIVGLDIARGGDDNCVFWFRQGTDARSIPPVVIPGEQMRDSMRLVTIASDILQKSYNGHRVKLMVVDATGVGGPVGDRLRQMGHANVLDCQFGGESPDPQLANMRAYIWKKMRDWLSIGALPRSTDSKHGAALETDLCGPGYAHDKRDRLLLESKEEMKKRGAASPDYGDGLALTFTAVPTSSSKAEDEWKPRGRTYMSG